ncbi:glutathione S-transferase [Hypoxylon cercidicola]|nr:glutathione S-transferase [Hypoxylon cercidicola]
MAPFGKIYSYQGNYRVGRAQVVAALNGLDVPLVEDFQMRVTNTTPEFLSKFPLGKVPALECADGFCVTEGGAMCTYLARSGPKAEQLLGADAKTEASIAKWGFFAETELIPTLMQAALMVLFKFVPFDEERFNKAGADTLRLLKYMEVGLQGGKKYLVGDELTLADIMVVGPMFFGAKFFIDAEMRKEVPNVVAWLQGLAALPEFKPMGELVLCETRTKA